MPARHPLLANVARVNATAIAGALTLDQVSEAVERIETNYGTPSTILMSPAVWGDVARLKDSDARYQLSPDPTGESRRQLFGVKVYVLCRRQARPHPWPAQIPAVHT